MKTHLTKRATWASLVGLLSVCFFIPILESPASAATRIVLDSFTNNSSNGILQATSKGWSIGGDNFNLSACSASITPCMISNRLRLVNKDQTLDRGYALYDLPQTTRAGIDISFNAALYDSGGTAQADGLVFYLKNGSNTATGNSSLGVAGGSMGYSSTNVGGNNVGLSGALLGIGFDAYGNFYHQPYGSLDGSCPADSDEDPLSPYSLIIRGPANADRQNGYCRIPATNEPITTAIRKIPPVMLDSTYKSNSWPKEKYSYNEFKDINNNSVYVENSNIPHAGLANAVGYHLKEVFQSGQYIYENNSDPCILSKPNGSPLLLTSPNNLETTIYTPSCETLDNSSYGRYATNIDNAYASSSQWPVDNGNVYSGFNFQDPSGDYYVFASSDGTFVTDPFGGSISLNPDFSLNVDSTTSDDVFTQDPTTGSWSFTYFPSWGYTRQTVAFDGISRLTYSYEASESYPANSFSISDNNGFTTFTGSSGMTCQIPDSYVDQDPNDYYCDQGIPLINIDFDSLAAITTSYRHSRGVDLTGNPLFSQNGVKVRIVIDPNNSNQGQYGTGSIYFGDPVTGVMPSEPLTQFALPKELSDAATFKFGFVAGTGGGALNAEIWSVGVSSLTNIAGPTISNFAIQGTWPGCSAGSATFTVSQGVAPYSVELLNAPPGIAVNNVEGSSTDFVISGTAPPPRSVEISIKVTDSQNPAVVVTTPKILVFSSAGNTCSTDAAPPPPVSGSLSWSIGGKTTKIFSTQNSLTLTRTFSASITVTDQGKAFLLQASLNDSGSCDSFSPTSYFISAFPVSLTIVDGTSPTSGSHLSRGSCYQWTQDTATVAAAIPPTATQTVDTTTAQVEFTKASLTSNILVLPKAISTHWPSIVPVDPRASYVDLPFVAPPTGASQIHFCVMIGTQTDWSNTNYRTNSKLGDLTSAFESGIGNVGSESPLTFSLSSSGFSQTSDSAFAIDTSEADFTTGVTKVRVTTTATNRFAHLSYILVRTVPNFASTYGIESSCTTGKAVDVVQPLPGEAAVIQILPYGLSQTVRRAPIAQTKRN